MSLLPGLVIALAILAYLFSRVIKPATAPAPAPKTPKAGSRLSPDKSLRAAVHEAGHAVVALRCTAVTNIHSVSINPVQGTGGVDYRLELGTNALFCNVVIGMGGIAAETSAFGSFRGGGAHMDLITTREAVEELLSKGELASDSLPVKPRKSRGIRLERAYQSPPSQETLTVLEAAYDIARDVLEEHGGLHTRLTGLLLHKHSLNEHELSKIVPGRVILRAQGIFRAKFV